MFLLCYREYKYQHCSITGFAKINYFFRFLAQRRKVEMQDLTSQTISETSDLKTFLEMVQIHKHKVFFVVNNQKRYIGTASEGDLRRYIVKYGKLPTTIDEFANKDSDFLVEGEFSEQEDPLFSIIHVEKFRWLINPVLFWVSTQTILQSTVPASKSIVTAIAPTRVSFAGGGSDLNYWFDDQPGCVVNLAINRFARVTIAKNYSSTCTIRSMNTGEILQLSSSDIPTYQSKLALVAACLRKCKIKDGLDIDIYSDFEPGTGLGGSSSLVIALVVGLSELSNYKFTRRQLINFVMILNEILLVFQVDGKIR